MNHPEIVSALGRLTPEQLADVRARCSILIQKGGAAPAGSVAAVAPTGRPGSNATETALQAMLRVLEERGADAHAGMARRAKLWGNFAAIKVPVVATYLAKSTKNRTELLHLWTHGFRLLAGDLEEQRIPVSVGVLMRHTGRLPGTFDRHFPGYAEAGLLKLLLGGSRTPS